MPCLCLSRVCKKKSGSSESLCTYSKSEVTSKDCNIAENLLVGEIFYTASSPVVCLKGNVGEKLPLLDDKINNDFDSCDGHNKFPLQNLSVEAPMEESELDYSTTKKEVFQPQSPNDVPNILKEKADLLKENTVISCKEIEDLNESIFVEKSIGREKSEGSSNDEQLTVQESEKSDFVDNTGQSDDTVDEDKLNEKIDGGEDLAEIHIDADSEKKYELEFSKWRPRRMLNPHQRSLRFMRRRSEVFTKSEYAIVHRELRKSNTLPRMVHLSFSIQMLSRAKKTVVDLRGCKFS